MSAAQDDDTVATRSSSSQPSLVSAMEAGSLDDITDPPPLLPAQAGTPDIGTDGSQQHLDLRSFASTAAYSTSPPMTSLTSSFRPVAAVPPGRTEPLRNSSLHLQKHEGQRTAPEEDDVANEPIAHAATSGAEMRPSMTHSRQGSARATDVAVVPLDNAHDDTKASASRNQTPGPAADVSSSSLVSASSGGANDHQQPQQHPQQPSHSCTPLEGFDLFMDDVSLVVIGPIRCLPRQQRFVLSHVSAFIPAGAIACVLALELPPASAVLSVLSGATRKASGVVLANALPANSDAFHAYVAYITSVSGIDMESTVETNLLFSTRMRVAMRTSGAPTTEEAEETRRVRQAADTTLLSRFLHCRVKELTPSQLYQLAIAMELVRDPTVIFLDAPLHYFPLAEMHTFLTVLSNLMAERDEGVFAEEGSGRPSQEHPQPYAEGKGRRTVVLSATDIPLPLYSILTHLIVLSSSNGKVLYAGEEEGIESFFDNVLGIPNVQGEMVCDLLAQMEDAGSTDEMAAKYSDSDAYRALQQQLREHRERGETNSFSFPASARGRSGSFTGAVTRAAVIEPGYAEQLRLLTVFTLRKHFLNLTIVIPWVSLLIAIVVMFLVLALAGSGVGNHVQNRCGVVFLLLSCSLLVNSVFFDTEIEECTTFVHMRNNSYFRVSQYIITTALRLLLPRLVMALLAACCSLLILRASSLPLIIVLVLTSLAHAHLFMLLLYWMPTRASVEKLWHAQYWYYGYCVIFSGFLVSLSNVPVVLQCFSLLRIGYGGLVATELRDSQLGCEENGRNNSATGGTTSDARGATGVPLTGAAFLTTAVLQATDPSLTASGYGSSSANTTCFTGELYLQQRGLVHDGWGRSTAVLFLAAALLFAALSLSMYATRAPRRL